MWVQFCAVCGIGNKISPGLVRNNEDAVLSKQAEKWHLLWKNLLLFQEVFLIIF